MGTHLAHDCALACRFDRNTMMGFSTRFHTPEGPSQGFCPSSSAEVSQLTCSGSQLPPLASSSIDLSLSWPSLASLNSAPSPWPSPVKIVGVNTGPHLHWRPIMALPLLSFWLHCLPVSNRYMVDDSSPTPCPTIHTIRVIVCLPPLRWALGSSMNWWPVMNRWSHYFPYPMPAFNSLSDRTSATMLLCLCSPLCL